MPNRKNFSGSSGDFNIKKNSPEFKLESRKSWNNDIIESSKHLLPL